MFPTVCWSRNQSGHWDALGVEPMHQLLISSRVIPGLATRTALLREGGGRAATNLQQARNLVLTGPLVGTRLCLEKTVLGDDAVF